MRKILWIMFLGLCTYAWAANYSNPIAGIFRGVYGDMITVEVPSQVSKSPVTQSQMGDVSFHINSNTIYNNFSQLSDLIVGDQIDVAYTSGIPGQTGNPGRQNELYATAITKLGPASIRTAYTISHTTSTTLQPVHNYTAVSTTTTTQY